MIIVIIVVISELEKSSHVGLAIVMEERMMTAVGG